MAMLLAAQGGLAAEYALDSRYSLKANYDDASNTALGDELFDGEFEANWDFRRGHELGNQSIDLDLRQTNFNDADRSRTNGSLRFTNSRNWERGNYIFSIGRTLSTVRTRRLDSFGHNQFFVLDLSRVETDTARFSASYLMSPRDTLQFSISGRKREYDSEFFTDFDSFSGSLLYSRAVNERFSVQLDVSAFRLESTPSSQLVANPNLGILALFDPCASALAERDLSAVGSTPDGDAVDCLKRQDGENTQDTYSYRIGLNYDFTEKLSLNFLVGPRETTTDSRFEFSNVDGAQELDPVDPILIEDQRGDGLSFQLSLDYVGERLRTEFNAESNEVATSRGILNQEERFEIFTRYAVSPTINVRAEAQYIQSETLDPQDTVLFERDSYRLFFSGSWDFAQHWSLVANVWKDFRETGGTGTDTTNVSNLTLVWNPQEKVW